MRLLISTVILGLVPSAVSFTFTNKHENFLHARITPKTLNSYQGPLYMSDSQPSDSSSEDLIDTVDVESEDYNPTEGEAIVTSLLDEMPLDITANINKESRAKINEALLKLEQVTSIEDPTTSPLLNGVWSLRYAGGYTSDWALPSPTRQLALFLYSGGYSPGIFALSLAQNLPKAICETGDLTISMSRDQPRIEATIGVKFIGGTENEISVKARLDVDSAVRFTETYESASVLGQSVEIPEALQYSRDLIVTYVDEDILVVRDASGVPEVLVRKEYGA